MKRSKFSLSHYRLTTCDMGQLIPLTWYEALPGDTIQHRTSLLIRATPLLSPVMHPVRVRIHNWFVPLRLIWDNFEDFITGGPDGLDATDPPRMTAATVAEKTIQDYMGIPTGDYSGLPGGTIGYSALPFRAYQTIFNEWYRDQDLISEVDVSKADGVDSTTSMDLQRVSWERDYFTCARPWEQKGAEITIPLGGSAPVDATGNKIPLFRTVGGSVDASLRANNTTDDAAWSAVASNSDSVEWFDPKLAADLTQATGISINDLRFSLAMQRYMENRAHYGSRYVEFLRSYGIKSSDARLQNPEFLGGGRSVIQFSEVLRHGAESGATDHPIGEMLGHGIGATRSNRYRRFFEEHGIVMSLMSIVPKAIYTGNLERKWTRLNKEDYFQRELQYLGDQEIKNLEAQAAHSVPDGTFGYQRRYDEYRYIPSGVSGEFRSTLNHWHMAREHSGDIALNESFIQCNPTNRIFADQTSNSLLVMSNHSIQARRMIQKNPQARTF